MRDAEVVPVKPRFHLASLVEDWRRNGQDRAVVSHRGNRVLPTTYRDLSILAGRFAAGLRDQGVAPGERVLLWGENSAEWMAAFFGCILCGVIVVPLDASGSAEFANKVVVEVAPRLIVGDRRLLRTLESAEHSRCLAELGDVLPGEPDFQVDGSVELDAPLQIVFTSGTTSEPKGVVHTHRNVLASVAPIEAEIGRYQRYERPFHPLRFLHTLPLSHVFGQFMGLWLPALLSAEVHFVDSLEPARLLSILKRQRISVLVAVPRILEVLRVHLVQRFPGLPTAIANSVGIPAWKRWWRFRQVHRVLGFKFWALICGGATLPGELEGFWNGLGLALIQGYGMTETAALVTLNHPLRVAKGTLGKALPGREVRLSSQGEIEVRGDMLAAGTWREGHFLPRSGEWLATGDLGIQESSGELRFAGRKGDVLVTAAGLNIYPQDLEAALLAQAGVRGCAVVAGETLRGVEPVAVVLFEGDDAALRRAAAAANATLAAFQQMGYVLRWPEPGFPYTATGKLLRRRIADWACLQIAPSHTGSHAGPDDGKMQDPLLRLIGEITREPVVNPAPTQRLTEDLHLDSLGRVQLQSALEEQFGVEIGEERMASAGTLGELFALLGRDPGLLPLADPPRPDMTGERGQAASLATAASGPSGKERNAASYPRWPWSAPVRWLRAAFVEAVLRPLVWLIAAPRVLRSGEAQLRGPLLLVANHVNTYDVPLILYALPGYLRRHVATAMSAEVLADMRRGRNQGSARWNLLARPASWLLVTLFNVFPLPRLQGFRRSFAHAGEALDRGYSVLLFPEGRRGQTGNLQPFRPGIGLLVQASGVPVLPIALQGMGAAGRRRSGPRQIAVQIGEPIRFASDLSAEEITRRLQAAVRALGPS